ncbi:MAG: DNA polymerase III subunit delta' [Bryobacterales bacterium]|nr:DNA polymerase III subunit delta' [Bryobacterales bacterium]
MFDNFIGNPAVVASLATMARTERIPQTILLDGPEGVGKATLARRFGALLLGQPDKIEQDDLSLPHNGELIAEREKWTSEKRAEDPLLFSTHPDFVTFPPEGPLRQISIQQMRLLKERAQFKPLKGRWRVFLIDQMDRANAQAADSLLKTLEEPPEHLIIILTAENVYDLPATIRSRSVSFHLSPLSDGDMRQFIALRGLTEGAERLALAGGSPGLAASLDFAAYEKRRAVLIAMLEASAGEGNFATWVTQSESFVQSKPEKLDRSIKLLYSLLEDLLVLSSGGSNLRNRDLEPRLQKIAARVSFEWIRKAVSLADEFGGLQRRNVQKGLIIDHFVVSQRATLATRS